MIKITKEQKELIKNQCSILKSRIETEENNIPYNSMCRILSKITDRFDIMLEEIFELK